MGTTTTRATVATNTYTSAAYKTTRIVKYIRVAYTSTATVGNRQLMFQLKDSAGNVIFSMPAGVVQAASLVYDYNFFADAPLSAAVVANTLCIPLPEDFIIEPNQTFTVYDSANIAVADSMVVSYQDYDPWKTL